MHQLSLLQPISMPSNDHTSSFPKALKVTMSEGAVLPHYIKGWEAAVPMGGRRRRFTYTNMESQPDMFGYVNGRI